MFCCRIWYFLVSQNQEHLRGATSVIPLVLHRFSPIKCQFLGSVFLGGTILRSPGDTHSVPPGDIPPGRHRKRCLVLSLNQNHCRLSTSNCCLRGVRCNIWIQIGVVERSPWSKGTGFETTSCAVLLQYENCAFQGAARHAISLGLTKTSTRDSICLLSVQNSQSTDTAYVSL